MLLLRGCWDFFRAGGVDLIGHRRCGRLPSQAVAAGLDVECFNQGGGGGGAGSPFLSGVRLADRVDGDKDSVVFLDGGEVEDVAGELDGGLCFQGAVGFQREALQTG